MELPHTAACLVCGRDNPHGLHLHLHVDAGDHRQRGGDLLPLLLLKQCLVLVVRIVACIAQAILAELYSAEEMLFLLDKDSDVVAKFLAEKMKST